MTLDTHNTFAVLQQAEGNVNEEDETDSDESENQNGAFKSKHTNDLQKL